QVIITAAAQDLVPATALQAANVLINGTLTASVASNNLTIALKTLAGGDPSALDPVVVGFRNATLASGNYVNRVVAAAKSVTINAGNTMGAADGVPFRLWILAFDNGSDITLGAVNCLVGGGAPTQVFGLDESALQSPAGGNGGSSAATFYAAGALSSKPFRIIGYMEWASGLTTAGTWNAAPSKIQLFGPGVKKPGDVIQQVYTTTSTQSSTTSTSFQPSSLSTT